MTKASESRWAVFLIAATAAFGVGVAGTIFWQTRPEAKLSSAAAAADVAMKAGQPNVAWSQIERMRAVDDAAADYYEALLLIRAPQLASDGKASIRAAQMLRRAATHPKYADRARLALAQLLIAQPALARSPDEAIAAIRTAAQRGNKRAILMLAQQIERRPDGDKMEVLRLMTRASETNETASEELIGLLESRSLPVKSAHLLNDIRYRQFIRQLNDAKAGDAESMVKVGDAYREGTGTAKDIKTAREWYNRSIKLDNNLARLRLIDLLRLDGTPNSAVEAHRLAIDAARDGKSVGAYTELGRDFKLGRGTTPDLAQAEMYLRKAIAMNSGTARYELADMLLSRKPETPEANAEALALLGDAAKSGNASAAWMLYKLQDTGQRGLTLDRNLAFAYLMQAAKAGRSGAQAELAGRYSRGDEIVPRNDTEAFNWASSALDGGTTSANLLLIMADAYTVGEVVPQDRLRAKAFLEAGVKLGNARAMRKLGALYFTLQEPNAAQSAVRWLREASLHGESDAYVDLGRAYASGAGVPVDPAKAFAFFEQADHAGNLEGTVEMARSFATGYGVGHDPVQAAGLYRRAADAGSSEAMIMLSYCYETGEGVPKSLPDARIWLQKGADAGDPEAQYWYGIYLLEGRGGVADRARAISFFEQAKNRKFKPAVAIYNQMVPQKSTLAPAAPAHAAAAAAKPAATPSIPAVATTSVKAKP